MDIFTKPLPGAKFRRFRDVLCGYRSFESLVSSPEDAVAIKQLQANQYALFDAISLDGHPLGHLV